MKTTGVYVWRDERMTDLYRIGVKRGERYVAYGGLRRTGVLVFFGEGLLARLDRERPGVAVLAGKIEAVDVPLPTA